MRRWAWTFGLLLVVQACGLEFGPDWRNPSPPPRTDALPALIGERPEIVQAFRRFNEIRFSAGLGPLRWDPEMASAAEKHARYLAINDGLPETTGLNRHNEYDYLPGYTPEGANAGSKSNVSTAPPDRAIDRLVNTLYHRTPMLHPALEAVGIGWANVGDVHATVVMHGPRAKSSEYPVAYPPNDATDVPWTFTMTETPAPIPDDAATTGFPVTLAYDEDVTDVVVGFYDGHMEKLPIHLSTPENPARTDASQGKVVCLFPKAPLSPGERYTVEVSATHSDGARRHWRWGFQAANVVEVDPRDESALRGAIGKYVRMHSSVASTRMTTNGGHALRLGQPAETPLHVWIRGHAWRWFEKAGLDSPTAFTGAAMTISGQLAYRDSFFELELFHPDLLEESEGSRDVDTSRPDDVARALGEGSELRTVAVRPREPHNGDERMYLATGDGRHLSIYARPEAFEGLGNEIRPVDLIARPLVVRGVVRKESEESLMINVERPDQWRWGDELPLEFVDLDTPRAIQNAFGRLVRLTGTVTGTGENETGLYLILGSDRAPSNYAFLQGDVWDSLQAQGFVTLEQLKKRTVEIVAAPMLSPNDASNGRIHVVRPDQMRVLPAAQP